MKALMNGLYTYVTIFQPLVYYLIAIALIIVGIMFILPFEETKNAAKKSIPFIMIGGGIILGATELAKEFANSFTFGGDEVNALEGAIINLKSYMI